MREVTIKGVTYPNANEAAAALKLSRSYIYALDRGEADEDRIGQSRGRPQPIKIAGHLFASHKEAAQAVGLKPNTLSQRLSGRAGEWGRADLFERVKKWLKEREHTDG